MDLLRKSIAEFASMPPRKGHDLARSVLGSALRSRLIIGRLLIGVKRSGAYKKLGAHSLAFYVCHTLGMESWEAKQCCRVARKLEELPVLRQAAEAGLIPWGKLRLVVQWATPDTDAYWAKQARKRTVKELHVLRSRQTRGAGEPVFDRQRLSWWLEPETIALLEKAMRKVRKKVNSDLSTEQVLQVIAAHVLLHSPLPQFKDVERLLVEARRDVLAEEDAPWFEEGDDEEDDVPPPPRPVQKDVESLQSYLEQEEPERTVTFPEEPIGRARDKVDDWRNKRLKFNPQARTVTPAQAEEIRRRDGQSCAVPGCPNGLYSEIHHIEPYKDDGETVPGNLTCLCTTCHAAVHEGELEVTQTPDGKLRFTDAHGSPLGRFSGYGELKDLDSS